MRWNLPKIPVVSLLKRNRSISEPLLLDKSTGSDSEELRLAEMVLSNKVLARDLQTVFALLDSVCDGVVLISPTGKILFANRNAEPFLNQPPAEVRGKAAAEVLLDKNVLNLLGTQNEEGLFHGARTVELPPVDEPARGCYRVSHTTGVGSNDRNVGETLVFQDVTQNKNAERMQVEFVDSVAHEFRTPLTSIQAYVELLLDNEAGDEATQRNFYNIIYEETHRLSQLIDNLLNLSMLETGAANIHIAPTRLKKLLQDCVDVVLPQCESHSIRLVADLPDRLPTLDLDKSLFTVAIMNILGNAVKYTPDGGTVTLFTVSKEDDFLIIIQDNGIGIPDTYLPRIFEKFFRCPAGEDQKRPGSGVGLATAMQIVRIHGGNIGVQSKIGEGTQFTILLPRSLINSSVGD